MKAEAPSVRDEMQAFYITWNRVDLLNGPEHRQHRQECLCHIDPACFEELLEKAQAGVAQTLLSVL
jgi:hypothetical protein